MKNQNITLTTNEQVVDMISREIRIRLKDTSGDIDYKVVLAAYLMAKIKLMGHSTGAHVNYDDITTENLDIREDIINAIRYKITPAEYERLRPFIGGASASEFASAAVYYNIRPGIRAEADQTPESIIKLARRLLNIESGDRVADLCCGIGSFITSTGKASPNASYEGYELNINKLVIAMIRAELLGISVNYQTKNVFDLYDGNRGVYDKVFAHFPLNIKKRDYGFLNQYSRMREQEFPGLSRCSVGDWIFAELACCLINNDGKAAVVMQSGSLWNGSDASIRRDFIEKGLVETAILLPEKLFEYTPVNAALYILSRGNTMVHLIDARKICHQGRRYNEFSDTDIEEILAAFDKDTDHSMYVTLGDLRKNDYSLNVSKYYEDTFASEFFRMEEIITDVSRGMQVPASQLDELTSDEPTEFRFLRLSDVQDGVIGSDMLSLKELDPRRERYCAHTGQLLISKNGNPFRSTIIEVPEGQKVLVNGNFYIVDLDQSKVDPYYVLAYLNSEKGMDAFDRLSVGTTVPMLSLETLRSLKIPALPIEEQHQIASEYRQAMDEVAMTHLKLKRAVGRLRKVYTDR